MANKRKRTIMKKVFRRFGIHFFTNHVGKNAAALAYYMLFALFPLLIFISNLLGLMDLNVAHIIEALQRLMPKDIVGLIEAYLDHVSQNSNHLMLWFSLIFSVWFPMRAVQGLMDDVRRAYSVNVPKRPVAYTFRQLLYTVIFLLALILTLVLSTMGTEVIEFINRFLPEGTHLLSGYLLQAWQYLRFLPISLLMFLAIGTLYAGSLDQRTPVKSVLPGIFIALISWLLISMAFSFYVENFAQYSLIYGTLGAVIVLLIWLYMTALVLILGAEFNAALMVARREVEELYAEKQVNLS